MVLAVATTVAAAEVRGIVRFTASRQGGPRFRTVPLQAVRDLAAASRRWQFYASYLVGVVV
jgi:hypothetical protein